MGVYHYYHINPVVDPSKLRYLPYLYLEIEDRGGMINTAEIIEVNRDTGRTFVAIKFGIRDWKDEETNWTEAKRLLALMDENAQWDWRYD